MTELEQKLNEMGVEMTCRWGQAVREPPNKGMTNNWQVQLAYQGRRYTCDFFAGASITKITKGDVVYSLLMDAMSVECTDSFEDWSREFGYGVDSITALNLYNLVKAQSEEVKSFFSDSFDLLVDLEH